MTTVLTIIGIIAITAIAVPLALLLLYALANALKLPFADRILAGAVHALVLEFAVGTFMNIAGGIVIVSLGLWAAVDLPRPSYRLLALLILPYGLWRIWLGVAVSLPAKRQK